MAAGERRGGHGAKLWNLTARQSGELYGLLNSVEPEVWGALAPSGRCGPAC